MKLRTALKLLSIPVFLYSFFLLTIYFDIYDKRPFLSLIKNIQSNTKVMGYPAKNIRNFLKESKLSD